VCPYVLVCAYVLECARVRLRVCTQVRLRVYFCVRMRACLCVCACVRVHVCVCVCVVCLQERRGSVALQRVVVMWVNKLVKSALFAWQEATVWCHFTRQRTTVVIQKSQRVALVESFDDWVHHAADQQQEYNWQGALLSWKLHLWLDTNVHVYIYIYFSSKTQFRASKHDCVYLTFIRTCLRKADKAVLEKAIKGVEFHLLTLQTEFKGALNHCKYYACVCACVCMRVRACKRTCMRACLHARVCECVHVCVCVCVYVYVCAYIRVFTCAIN